MARHRNVRTMNYDEFDDEDDYPYGHSVEDECISPTDASQWIYDRAKGQQSISEFLANNHDIEEEDDDDLEADTQGGGVANHRRDSCYQLPDLNDEDKARLLSCMEEIRNIVGDTNSDKQLVDAIMKNNYDLNKSLDEVLNATITPPKKPVIKEIKTPIEKDSNLSKFITAKQPQFGIPKISFPTTTKSNLSDLVKSRLQQEDENLVIPKLSNLTIASHSTEATNLLNLAESTTQQMTIEQPSSFTNLSELAKFHLKSNNSDKKFIVPNLFGKTSKSPFSTPHLTPKKTIEIKANIDDPILQKEWIIDLKAALITDHTQIIQKPSMSKQTETEIIPYRFIDCDIIVERPVIDDYCELDISSILGKKFKNFSREATVFGKTLCRKYHRRNIPRVKHGFVGKNVLKPFNFKIPSPDDVILEHLRKFKR